MVLGVMSDTHGNAALMHEVAETMVAQFAIELIWHLGDDYVDAAALVLAGHTIRRLPGLWCPEYHDSRIPRRLLEACDGVTVAGAHAQKDLRHTERAAAVILTGHTHQAAIDLIGRSLLVNPGHLAKHASRGERASYAVIDIRPKSIRASIRELSGTIRIERTVARSKLG